MLLRRALLALVTANAFLVCILFFFAVHLSLRVSSLVETDKTVRTTYPELRRLTGEERDPERLRAQALKALDMSDTAWTGTVRMMREVRSGLVALAVAAMVLLALSVRALVYYRQASRER